jgi:hypothetical protein
MYRYTQYSLLQSIKKGDEVTINDLGSDLLSLSRPSLYRSPIFFSCEQNALFTEF